MSCTLRRADVAATLAREHEAAQGQNAGSARLSYLAVRPEQGRLLYGLARAIGARAIVEFGTSFGVSTMYLAAAAWDTGGRVVGSELHPDKAAKARRNLADAGLADRAEVRVGDARETLAGIEGPVDLLFLDGAKELYLPVLRMLEARLRPGAVVLADNVDMAAVARGGFLDHVTDPKGRYLTARLGFDNSELSHSVVVG